MNYKDITNRMKVGEVYNTDKKITSIAQELGIPKEDVRAALDSAPNKFIKRSVDSEGNDVCELLMHPLPNDSRN